MLSAAQVRHVPDKRPPLSAACPVYGYKRRIGVMGGSFNPAHKGHLHIALHARRAGKLDEIWWLVSPQNPLKTTQDMADFASRIASARIIAKPHFWIKVLDFEQRQGLRYTTDSLNRLARHCRRADLIWIMGADNLIQFPKWKGARTLSRRFPVMIINRPGFHYRSLASGGAALLNHRRRNQTARQLSQKHGGWHYVHSASDPMSSTALRGRNA